MRNCCEINTLSVLKTFCLMYDNMPKILSHTLSRQSCLQLLMYYLIYNYRPCIILKFQILVIPQLIQGFAYLL